MLIDLLNAKVSTKERLVCISRPRRFGKTFTESELKSICEKSDVDFKQMKLWYYGYSFKNIGSVYNPNSVIKAARNDDFDSYWTETSAAEGLMEYISRDYNGLTKTIAELIAGTESPEMRGCSIYSLLMLSVTPDLNT